MPKKLKPKRELTIAKDIMTTAHNSAAACSVYFKRTGDRLSRQFVYALKHTNDNLEATRDDTTAAGRLLKALDEHEDVNYIAMFGDDSSELFTETPIHGHVVQQETHAVDAHVAASLKEIRKSMETFRKL